MDFENIIRDMIDKELEKHEKILLKKVNQKIDNYFQKIEKEIKNESDFKEHSLTKSKNQNLMKEEEGTLTSNNSLKGIINSLYKQVMDKSDSILGKKREQAIKKRIKNENPSFRGLTFFKHKWVVILIYNNNRIYGGRFTDKYIAAKAYDSLVKKHIGFKEGYDKMNFKYTRKSDILPIETLLKMDKEKKKK